MSFYRKFFLSCRFCFILLTFLVATACADPEETKNLSLVNTSQLEHLYEEVSIDSNKFGLIWIYSEAPDYHLVADDDEGFTCVDDVARALVFYCHRYSRTPSEEALEKIRSLTEFLLYMQAENGYFYNFLLPGPQINKTHPNSQAIPNWWSWRAFWALSEMRLLQSEALSDLQKRCQAVTDTLTGKIGDACPVPGQKATIEGITIPACFTGLGADQVAVMMMGLCNEYELQPSEKIRSLLITLGELLLVMQQGDEQKPPHFAFLSWRNYWHAWGNSQAFALLRAGRILQHRPFEEAGLKEVQHFYPYCLENSFLSGFSMVEKGDQALVTEIQTFPQIAYGIRPMIFASLEAYLITRDSSFAETAGQLATWFFGNNPAGQLMYNASTGRTFDGIGSPEAVNYNSGAESTIEGLLSLQAIDAVPPAKEVLESYIEEH